MPKMQKSSLAEGQPIGYLPHQRPPLLLLIFLALQTFLATLPATATVAYSIGFPIEMVICSTGVATLVHLLVTRGKMALYHGGSFAYIPVISGVTGMSVVGYGNVAASGDIGRAMFGTMISGLVSIALSLLAKHSGPIRIGKLIPKSVAGSIAFVIGAGLFTVPMRFGTGYDPEAGTINPKACIVLLFTFAVTCLFAIYGKGIFKRIPVLIGMVLGYFLSGAFGFLDGMGENIARTEIFTLPRYSVPVVDWLAAVVISVAVLATVMETLAHFEQYKRLVNRLSSMLGLPGDYLTDKDFPRFLASDGFGDIGGGATGGPGNTSHAEAEAVAAMSRTFSWHVTALAAVFAIAISFIGPVTAVLSNVPAPVINGACILLFWIIAALGLLILADQLFEIKAEDGKISIALDDSPNGWRNMGVMAIVIVVGLGGGAVFPDGLVPIAGDVRIAAIAIAAVLGIITHHILGIRLKKKETSPEESDAA